MKFPLNSPLFLDEVYEYDIPQCHYNILKINGYDISDIPFEDKFERNKKIGLMMRSNPRLTKFLRETTTSIIDGYIKVNELKESDILLRQYDGILVRKRFALTDEMQLSLKLKHYYTKFIISFDRNMYIAMSGGDVVIKGIPHLYPKMEKYLNKILHINFLNVNSIATLLKKIKEEFYSSNINLFMIPSIKDKYEVILKNVGQVSITESAVKIGLVDLQMIDIDKYFESYLVPFLRSIVFHFF